MPPLKSYRFDQSCRFYTFLALAEPCEPTTQFQRKRSKGQITKKERLEKMNFVTTYSKNQSPKSSSSRKTSESAVRLRVLTLGKIDAYKVFAN